jgi:ribonuclease BN (tRNA processing enzyme)
MTRKLRLRFLGTGNAFNADGRGSQALWVEPPSGSPFLVDAGPTVLQAASRFAVDPALIDRVFITHHHGDHTAGWPFLLLHLVFLSRRARPLLVFGPEGTRAHLSALAAACYGEVLSPAELPFALDHRELGVAAASDLDGGEGLRFDVIPMDHHPSSIGYRLRAGGVTVAVSGDTRWCPGLVELAAGCDLLVLECTLSEPGESAHLSLAEVRDRAASLAARRIVLVHCDDSVARALAAGPIPRVEAAADGAVVEVASRES